MKKFKEELVFKLFLAVVLGIIIGSVANSGVISFVLVVKNLIGQIIFFTIPLIIIGFIAPSIAQLKQNATKLLSFALGIAYLSTLGAGLFSMLAGYVILPMLNINPVTEELRSLPELIFNLNITQIMPVMSALVLSLMLGLAVSYTKTTHFEALLNEFQAIVLYLVTKIVIPILPIFIGSTFASLAYEGSINKHLPVFLIVIILAIIGQLIWLVVLYTIGGLYSKTNPKEVYRHYLPAYFTAVGTMSSAATLPVALSCASKSTTLKSDTVNFGIPLFTNIHLCGSVLTEVFFVMVVSQVMYGSLPTLGNLLLFVVLLGVFGIGAPGVPGGTVMASLGLITSVLGFNEEGTALMLTIFALQDSFGTACNVTGDGALTLILNTYSAKSDLKD